MAEALQIFDCGSKQGGIVFESAKANVAMLTEELSNDTYASGRMIVVNMQMNGSAVALAAGRITANGTYPVLSGEHYIVVVDSYTVFTESCIPSPFVSGKLLFEQFSHIWKRNNIWNKFSESATASAARVFFAGMKMYLHSSEAKWISAVTARSEFPATGAKGHCSPKRVSLSDIWRFAVSRLSTGFAFPLGAIGAGGMCIKISSGLDLLASRAQFTIDWNLWNKITNFLPMTAQFCWQYALVTEAAVNGSFA